MYAAIIVGETARLQIVNKLNVNLQGLLFFGETCCPKWATKIIEYMFQFYNNFKEVTLQTPLYLHGGLKTFKIKANSMEGLKQSK
jgi:hypothetical protein